MTKTTTIRRGPTLKAQAANTKTGGKQAGFRLPANYEDHPVDNNADITCEAPKVFVGLGQGSYKAHWGETAYIERTYQGQTTWIAIQPKETVLIECDRAMVSRSFSLSRTARLVGVPHYSVADQNLTIEVKPSPAIKREEGFVPATAKQRAAAIAEQLEAWGTTKPGAAGSIRSCDIGKAVILSNKKQIKSRELDRALSAAFESRALRPSEQINNALSLDTNHDSEWTPTSDDYLTELSEAEQEDIINEATQYRLELLFRTITDRQRAALLAAAEGKTTREIGADLGISQPAVSKLLNKARATAKAIGLTR